MSSFNLSDWALRHRSFVWFLMLVSLFAGALAYVQIGREEDPNFAIKTMVIQASLPGASVEETLTQVTDRIEKKLEDLDTLDGTRSLTRAGLSVVYVDLLDTVAADQLPIIWQDVRNMMSDIRGEFPNEFGGFSFNDDFGDVFGNIYAFTSDGFTPRELRDYVESARRAVQGLDDAGKVEIFGTRDQVVYIEFSTERLSALGLNQQEVKATLAAQNAILPSGVIDAGPERILVRTGGGFSGAQSVADVNLRVGGRLFRLTDVADVRLGYEDPPSELVFYNGQPAIGLSVGMRSGANIVDFGEELSNLMERVEASLPIGISIHQVADQPHVVEEAVGHFVQALIEAILIVLAVSFVSLGLRAGLVVTLTIPLVLAITFVIMHAWGFTLQRISLGALIIALGLLVDDAMIAIETMISRQEIGESLGKAASFAWTSIAFPMLTGTLVTVAGFIPIGLNSSAAGEFTFSLFVVIAVSLLVSWIVAVLFAPLIGVTLLPSRMGHEDKGPGRVRRGFHKVLLGAMRLRWLTIVVTLVLFGASVYGMRFVENQFFPSSDRPELIVDVTLPRNASIEATRAEVARVESRLAEHDDVQFWTSYVGRGAPRFILSYDVPTPGPNTGQIVIQTPDVAARDRLRADLEALARDEFPGTDLFVKLLEIGPPVGRPVQYRVTGSDLDELRAHARDFAALLASDPRMTNILLDWNEPARVVRVEVIQDRLRLLGLTSRDIASALATIYDGTTVTELRDSTYLVDMIARGGAEARSSIEGLSTLQLSAPDGTPIPLSSVAVFHYDTEQPLIRQEDRVPTITVAGAIATEDQPATIVDDLAPEVEAFARDLPPGFSISVGGSVESSAES
ncbi:Multidrug export protein AcrF [Roseisalinus antarcticus]|uniref:Multidrug export protein AcrF n=1 Tax=Roseisalinus antarcticus TaxID=254357 RepID=A0A1Y5SCW1_9RHOB|nr:Multidrug export protein AcrF [Roseisalinus antarcticus]